jgi:type IV pilus assembly protein PilF
MKHAMSRLNENRIPELAPKSEGYSFKIIFLSFLLVITGCSTSSVFNCDYHQAAKINIKLGLAYLEKGNLVEAERKLLQGLAEDPANYEGYDALGYLFERKAEVAIAAKYYVKAIEVASTNKGAAYNNYGAFLYRQQRYDEARKYFLLSARDDRYQNAEIARKNALMANQRIKSFQRKSF